MAMATMHTLNPMILDQGMEALQKVPLQMVPLQKVAHREGILQPYQILAEAAQAQQSQNSQRN